MSEFIKTNFSGGEVSVDETFDLISVVLNKSSMKKSLGLPADCTKKN